MPAQWPGLGPDLLIELDREAPTALRSQVEVQLRSAIQNGRLSAGERVPSYGVSAIADLLHSAR